MIGRRAAGIVTLAVTCALGLACSSDDSGDSADTSTESSAETPETTDPAEDSVADTEPAPSTTVVSADSELSAETCALLTELHEFNDGFNAAAVSGDLPRLQAFDAENAPRALEIYDELATQLPGSETDVEQARQLTVDLSGIIAGAASFDDVTGAMFALPDVGAANASVIAIDDLAVERCTTS